MNGRARAAGDQLQGLMMHGEHLLDHMEARSARLNRVAASAINVLLGVCVGMLIAYAAHLKLPQVDFMIVGPLLGGAGGALARLAGKDMRGHRRQERLRQAKQETANRLQMASQIVDFVRSQGRLLPVDVKDGAWAEVSRLVSNTKDGDLAGPTLLASVVPSLENKPD